MFEPEGLSKANMLLKKALATFLELFGAPIVIRRPGNCAPLAPPRYASVDKQPEKKRWPGQVLESI